MGSLVSGLFDLFSGDPTQKEQGQLADLSGFESNAGKGATTAATDYYSGILSGDPSKIAETLAPEIRAGQQSAEQQKKTNAAFGNRGGGTNAANQSIDSTERGNIIDLIGRERSGAAAGEAGIGTNLLSQAPGNINSEAGLAAANQQRLSGDVGGIANGVAQIAGDFFGGGGSIPNIGSTAAHVTPGADFGPPPVPNLIGMSGGVPDLGTPTLPDVSEGFAGLDY